MFITLLKLEDIAPTWVKAFESERWARLNLHEKEAIRKDLLQENRCIVGEAWGWKDDYLVKCEECKFFGYAFIFVLNGPEFVLDQELFMTKGKEFSIHWMEIHTCHILTKNPKKRKNTKKR